MISIVITAFKEPMVGRAIRAILDQDINDDYELVVAAPDKETEDLVSRLKVDHPQVRYFKDPGMGKSNALNMLFKELEGDVWVFTDGDVYFDKGAVNALLEPFGDEKVGCVGGRPVCENPRSELFGYWGRLLADCGAHRIRRELSNGGKFLECSAYIFAFRNNGVVAEIPLDVAEDAMIPYYFWKKGFKIAYAGDARVFVKNPTNFKDWMVQRKRTADAHTKLTKYEPDFPKIKSFRNEVSKGLFRVWSYPHNLREFAWTGALIFVRLYMWLSLFYDLKFKGKGYVDGWERSESTKV